MDIFGILDPDPHENLCGSETLKKTHLSKIPVVSEGLEWVLVLVTVLSQHFHFQRRVESLNQYRFLRYPKLKGA